MGSWSHSLYSKNGPGIPALNLQVLINGVSESTGVGADNLADLLTALEEHESGHGSDIQFLGEVWNLVDVDLVELDLLLVGFRLAKLGDFGGDDFAGAAPGGETIENDESLGLEGGVEG